MRAWTIAFVAAAIACGRDRTNPIEESAGQPAPLAIDVALGGTGAGRIVSSPAGIACPDTCSASFAAGTQVTLTATPEASSYFDGFGSACSGQTCTLTTSGAVTAQFSRHRHTLTVEIDGAGIVTSMPAGVLCPGTCSAAFDEGASIALTATPAAGQTFSSWSSPCSGEASCSISIRADLRVSARFQSLAPNRCDTIVIPKLPTPMTRTALAWDMDPSGCGAVFGDGSGNLYLNNYYTLSNEKSILLSRVGLFVTLDAGFTAYTHQMAPVGSLIAYTPDGQLLSSTPMHGYMSTGGVQANGGIIGVEADCTVTKTIRVDRIDADGILTGTIELADQGCLTTPYTPYLEAVVDAADRLLIATDGDALGSAAIASGHTAARWFDAGGRPVTPWFDLGAGALSFGPLIGGGLVALNSSAQWVGSIASGETVLSAPPPGFRGRMVAALGGRAYARIGDGWIEFVDPSSGATCGSLTVPPGYFGIGGDGSLLYMDPEGRDRTTGLCTITVYPNVLR